MPGGPGEFYGNLRKPNRWISPIPKQKSPVFDVSAKSDFPIFGGIYTRGMRGAWSPRLPAL